MFGLAFQLVLTLVNFANRTILVRTLGMEVNGLNGLFTEVIAMLSLVELGVGSAITYNLYKPLAQNDEEKLCQLMSLFKKAYRIIAAVIFGIGLALVPVIQYLVKGTDFPLNYIRLVFALFVIQTASSYLFAYNRSLLIADQRNYVVSILTTLFRVLMFLAGIAALLTTHSFVLYLVIQIIFTVLSNIAVTMTARKRYPFLKRTAQLPPEEKKSVFANIKHLFISSLSGKITNSTDNILISVLVSTVQVGIYSNYSMIATAIKNVFVQIMSAMSGSVGNLLVTEQPQHCHKVLKRMTFLFFVCGFLASAGLMSVSGAFVTLCFGGDYLMDNAIVFVCALNLFFFILREPLWQVMTVSGLFARMKYISILGTVSNLVVSLLLGFPFGTIGILIGTTATLLIQFVLNCMLLYRKRFQIPAKQYLLYVGKMTLLAIVGSLFIWLLCSLVTVGSLVVTVLLRAAVSVIVTALLVVVFYFATPEFKYFWSLALKAFHKLLHRTQRS